MGEGGENYERKLDKYEKGSETESGWPMPLD